MFSKRLKRLVPLALVVAFAAGCDDDDNRNITGPDEQVPLRGAFILSNEETDNAVIFFPRRNDGTLGEARRFDTGGRGTGKSIIGAAHPLEFTKDRRFLLAVSAGSDQLTAFRVTEQGLQRTALVPSGGKKPVSVTIRDDGLVFVLNENGGEGGIAGFRLSGDGNLTPIPNSGRQLGEATQGGIPALPAQVELSPDGRVLVVTAKFSGPNNEGRIVTFTVGSDGLLSEPIKHPPFGRTPFGMDFTENGTLLVAEAFAEAPGNPIPNEGKLSSFRVLPSGALEVISRSVPALGSVTCWVETKGNFAFTTNTASDNITTFRVGPDGRLERLRLTPTGKGPIGIELSVDGNFLFNLNAGDGTITAFRVDEATGELTQIQKVNTVNPAFGLLAL